MLELARPEDRAAVNALARQVHALHVAWRPDIFEIPEELYPQERFQAAIAERQLYVAKLGGEIVGFALVVIRQYDRPGLVKRKVLILDEICVDEAYRRQGIGRQIMGDVKALARAFGCTDIQLGVYPQNTAALALYESAGMKIRSVDLQMKL